jgi:hypothetical protein
MRLKRPHTKCCEIARFVKHIIDILLASSSGLPVFEVIHVGSVFCLIIIRVVLPYSKVSIYMLRDWFNEPQKVVVLLWIENSLEGLAVIHTHSDLEACIGGHLDQIGEISIIQEAKFYRFRRFFLLCFCWKCRISCISAIICIILLDLGWQWVCSLIRLLYLLHIRWVILYIIGGRDGLSLIFCICTIL